MMAGTIPHFLLFSQLSFDQQKVSSSTQLGEYTVWAFRIQIETRKHWFFFFFFYGLETKVIKTYYTVDLKTSDLKTVGYSCWKHIWLYPQRWKASDQSSHLCVWVYFFKKNIRRESAEHKSRSKDKGQLEYCCTTTYKENISNVFFKKSKRLLYTH